jgi:nucleotide-binding universal stress UspA family protein
MKRHMRNILVATDFSTRSDRAIRRGMLMAKAAGASLILIHAVDDDQPQRLIAHQTEEAEQLLTSQTATLREFDGVDASFHIVLGDAFETLGRAAAERNSDLLILGPHRRQLLKDVFVGTTAERIIRTSSTPVVMANAMPAAPYRHMLVAVDMSESSAAALKFAAHTAWGEKPAISIFHAYDAPEALLRGSHVISEAASQGYIADANARTSAEVSKFVQSLGVEPVRSIIQLMDADPATMVRRAAAEAGADLIVIGARGRGGLSKFMLGSVAESLLRTCAVDVLAVPGPTPD